MRTDRKMSLTMAQNFQRRFYPDYVIMCGPAAGAYDYVVIHPATKGMYERRGFTQVTP